MTQSALWFMIAVWAIVFGNTLYGFWKLLHSSRNLDNRD